MIDYLKKQIKKNDHMIKYFNQKLAGCDICNGTGKIKPDSVNVGNFNFSFSEICSCQESQGKSAFDYKAEVKRLTDLNYKIESLIPAEYKAADIDLIDDRLKSFMQSDNVFCWIWGDVSKGKTFSLHAMRLKELINDRDIAIIKEFEIDYETPKNYRFKALAIDDLLFDNDKNRNAAILQYLFQLVDLKRENHTKLIMTANYDPNQFVKTMESINKAISDRIVQRMSKKTTVVKVEGPNRRV